MGKVNTPSLLQGSSLISALLTDHHHSETDKIKTVFVFYDSGAKGKQCQGLFNIYLTRKRNSLRLKIYFPRKFWTVHQENKIKTKQF